VGESLGFGVGASLLGASVVGEDVGVDEGFLDAGMSSLIEGHELDIPSLTEGHGVDIPSLIEGHGLDILSSLVEDFSVGCVVVLLVIKVVVVIIFGSSLVGDTAGVGESLELEVGVYSSVVGEVGESLGFGVDASLLGSSAVGENVGLKVGDVTVGRSVVGDSVTGFKVGPSLGIDVVGFFVGMGVSCIGSSAATTFIHHRRTFVPVKVAVISSTVPLAK
jgi:hypothetical protein